MKPQIQRISGVGDCNVMGGDYAMRVWMKPDVMAQYGLIPSDVSAALSSQNIEASTGAIGENSDNVFQYTLRYKGRLSTEEEFGEIVIRAYDDGRVLKLKDIADIELGAVSYNFEGRVKGAPGVTCMINQTAGSNANEIIKEIDAYLETVKADLPKGIEIIDIMSTKDFLDASIQEVIKTLFETILLVVLVVYIFLQSPRATLIPTICIFVALIATFAFMIVAGFTINLITLFALILVIGTVVDDAIIVVEAVQARFDMGYRSAYKAAMDGVEGVSAAVVSATLVFMAVFIPVSFLGGTSGLFYKQFGLTAPGEKPKQFSTRFRIAFEVSFGRMITKYKGGVKFFIKHKWVGVGTLVAACGLLVYFMATAKTSLVPNEDTGSLFISVDAAPGTTLAGYRFALYQCGRGSRNYPCRDQ